MAADKPAQNFLVMREITEERCMAGSRFPPAAAAWHVPRSQVAVSSGVSPPSDARVHRNAGRPAPNGWNQKRGGRRRCELISWWHHRPPFSCDHTRILTPNATSLKGDRSASSSRVRGNRLIAFEQQRRRSSEESRTQQGTACLASTDEKRSCFPGRADHLHWWAAHSP